MNCPTIDKWEALASGEVTDDELERLVGHLDACRDCEDRMRHWIAPSESFVPWLEQLGNFDPPPPDPVVVQLCQRLAAADVTNLSDPSESSTQAAALQTFGPYELRELLGRGGMGEVYKAWHQHLRRFVAIKFVSAQRAADVQFQRRFAREMATIGAIDSPHVVRALDGGTAGDRQYLVMELVEGSDAATLIKRRGRLPVAEACEIARQAALGLAAIAARGLIHRDVKPSNLYLSTGGVVKLLDLGLARAMDVDDEDGSVTSSRHVVGTPDYISPEQIHQEPLDIRADLYSLGCTLYHLLAGVPPFGSAGFRTASRKLVAQCTEMPAPLSGLPAGLPQILERMLAKSPADRFASPGEVVAALAPYCSGANLQALLDVEAGPPAPLATPVAPPAVVRQKPRRRLPWAVAALGSACAAALALALGTLAFSGSDAPDVVPGAPLSEEEPPGSGTNSHPEVLAELVWHHLLDKKPKELFWPHGVGRSFWTHMPLQETVVFSAGDQGALELGQSERTHYKLRAGFLQSDWTGGIGLYFGMHDITYKGLPAKRCQAIIFNQAAEEPLKAFLERQIITIYERDVGRGITVEPVQKAAIRLPRGEQTLELEIRSSRLTSVLLNGAPIDPLTDPLLNARFSAEDHAGGFGLTAHGADGSISDARWMLVPSDVD